MRIYFARHGESQANLRHEISNRGLQYGLTLKGREQANTLAQSLRNQVITHIYSSPILRAIETSIILANQLNLDYEIVDALREYDCGFLEGHSDEVSWQRWRELFDSWTVHKQWEKCIEGGETFLAIRNRFVPFIDKLISQLGGTETKILCVSHGGIYRLMLPLILRNVDEETVRLHGIDYTSCIVSELRSEGLFCVEWNGILF
ncbi:MAG: histidine phosphatase family protein [Chloroflexi bacterium]|nr:histidine phosphatase family protein [Chloroflexota bacterium]